jgi:integrase
MLEARDPHSGSMAGSPKASIRSISRRPKPCWTSCRREPSNGLLTSWMSDQSDPRLYHAHVARNREPILEVLRRVLPPQGLVLEVASGSGEHAAYFAKRLPTLLWQPTDPDPRALASIAAHRTAADASNLLSPLWLDAMSEQWPVQRADALVCINMIHITPWAACKGLMTGAERTLRSSGVLSIIRTVSHQGWAKSMAKSHLKLVAPSIVNRTVRPKRRPNRDLRTREHLTEAEVERLIEATKRNRYGHRDATMILVTYRHGLRASELTDLRWEQVDFRTASLHVRRVKKGTPSTHPVRGDELRALRRLQREQEPRSPFVFTSERGSPFTTAGFARMVERAGKAAKLPFKPHPHMLRHACGYALANRGHDTRALQAYLGHRNIQHTVRYTEMSPMRFKDFWRR